MSNKGRVSNGVSVSVRLAKTEAVLDAPMWPNRG